MSILLALLLFYEGPIPMTVKLKDPIPGIMLTTVDTNEQVPMNLLTKSGFFFFFLPYCEECQETFNLTQEIRKNYDCFILFVGQHKQIEKFLKEANITQTDNIFVVDGEAIRPLGMTAFPALLSYKEGHLVFAMHGPISDFSKERLFAFYEK